VQASRRRRFLKELQAGLTQAAAADISPRAVPSIRAAKPTPVVVDQATQCLQEVAEPAREQPELVDLIMDSDISDAETVILPFRSSLDYIIIKD
jgi:glyoxylate carboligase